MSFVESALDALPDFEDSRAYVPFHQEPSKDQDNTSSEPDDIFAMPAEEPGKEEDLEYKEADPRLSKQAACKGVSLETFFGPEGQETSDEKIQRERTARAICAACTVLEECRQYTIKTISEVHVTRDSIFAGMNRRERDILRMLGDPPQYALEQPVYEKNGEEEAKLKCLEIAAINLMSAGVEPTIRKISAVAGLNYSNSSSLFRRLTGTNKGPAALAALLKRAKNAAATYGVDV